MTATGLVGVAAVSPAILFIVQAFKAHVFLINSSLLGT